LLTQLAAELGRIVAAFCPPFLQVSPKGIQLRPPLPWRTFRELLRLEIPSNGETGDTELTRDRSFGDTPLVRRFHCLK
jgi:hypothetical protein